MTSFALGPLGVRVRKQPIPIPTGARVAYLGDSILQFNNAAGGAGAGPLSSGLQGEVANAQMLDPRFRCDVWLSTTDSRASRNFTGANQGIIGDTVASPGPAASPNGMLGRLATDILPLKPDICIVAGGTNNVTAPNNLAGLQTICATLASHGIKPVLCTVRPWAATRSGDGASSQQAMLALNAAIRSYAASTPSVTLCDLAAAYGCPGPAWAYAPAAWFGPDGLHPSAQGGYVGGKAIMAAIAPLVQSGNWLLNTFWAGPNLIPTASAILNGGTAGGTSAVISGTLATGLTAYSYAASTMVASLLPNPATGGLSQQFIITPSGGATTENLPLTLANPITSVVPGQYIIAFAEIEFDAWPAWAAAVLFLHETPYAAGTAATGMQPADTTKPGFAEARRCWIVTPPYLVSSAATAITLALSIYYVPNGASGTGTFKLHRWGAFAMPGPQAAWNS